MSTPIFNGGERRHSAGIRKSLQFYGRLVAAIAAGLVFAVLAYETPVTSNRESKKPEQAADRQSAVTEDGVLPLLDQQRARVDPEDSVGLSRTKSEDSPALKADARNQKASDGRGQRVTRADEDENLRRHSTAVNNSRGPPID